jgi:hypothetical protein
MSRLTFQREYFNLRRIPSNLHGRSKEDAAVAAAAVTESVVFVKRLPDHSSIFSAEAGAILLTLGAAEQSMYDRFVVLSDSLSCPQAIQNRKHISMSILEIVSRVHELIARGKKEALMWLYTQPCWSEWQLSGGRSRESRAESCG